jgi:hypothetical protein
MNKSVTQPSIKDTGNNTLAGSNLRPDLKAAMAVAIFFIGFEILGDLLPFVGYLITFPITLVIYYFQGLLTGYFIKRDSRYLTASSWRYAFMGLTSSLCTGLVLAVILATLSYVVTTPATLGLSLAELPFTLLTTLLDLVLNLIITTLAAWLFGLLNRTVLTGASCLILIFLLGSACLADILLGIGIVNMIKNIIPHLPSYLPFLHH